MWEWKENIDTWSTWSPTNQNCHTLRAQCCGFSLYPLLYLGNLKLLYFLRFSTYGSTRILSKNSLLTVNYIHWKLELCHYKCVDVDVCNVKLMPKWVFYLEINVVTAHF